MKLTEWNFVLYKANTSKERLSNRNLISAVDVSQTEDGVEIIIKLFDSWGRPFETYVRRGCYDTGAECIAAMEECINAIIKDQT